LNNEQFVDTMGRIGDPIIKELYRVLVGLAAEREAFLVNNGCNDMATYKKLIGWLIGANKCIGYIDGNSSLSPSDFAKFVNEDAGEVRSDIVGGECKTLDTYKQRAGEIEAFASAANLVDSLVQRAREDDE